MGWGWGEGWGEETTLKGAPHTPKYLDKCFMVLLDLHNDFYGCFVR